MSARVFTDQIEQRLGPDEVRNDDVSSVAVDEDGNVLS